MQVDRIQSNSFEAKRRFITPEMKTNMQYLLETMNDKMTYNTNGDCFKVTIYKALVNDKGNVKFQDGRIYFGDKLKRKELKGEALFTIGKTELVIDNKSGEIIDYYKPFYKTWKGIMKNIGKYLEFFKNNLNDEKLVKQKQISMQGFTEQGLKKFKQLKAGLDG